MKKVDTLALWYAELSSAALKNAFANPANEAAFREICQKDGSESIFDFLKSGYDLPQQLEKESGIPAEDMEITLDGEPYRNKYRDENRIIN